MIEWANGAAVPMMITFAISFIALVVGSATDLRTREVPDWLNYGLIFAGIGLNLMFSIIDPSSIIVKNVNANGVAIQHYVLSEQSYIINSILGLAVFFGIAYIMFYAGQWGGGDSKMLMGIGAMIGIDFSSKTSSFMFGFFISALFAGAVYGLLWSLFLAIKNRRRFSRELLRLLSTKKSARAKKILMALLAVALASLLFIKVFYLRALILLLPFLAIATFYLFAFIKSIEKSCMFKLVEPHRLTEGDWIVKDVYVDKAYICGPKDLGIEKRQIRKLVELYNKGKIKKILIKEGIPFVPSFLIAFVIAFVFGNPLYLFY